ncbi:MAG: twin transmembrane helix small protein [Proteobacteria bacterium]|nr:twin transmembrane helix small protein [Pseudomonadota bacterium]
MRIVVVILLVLILISMGSALFFLLADRSGSNRTARALTGRVGLSLLLFAMLMAAHYFGLIGERL